MRARIRLLVGRSLRCSLLLAATAASCASAFSSTPRRGEVGYKRHVARTALRRVIRELRTNDGQAIPVPPLTAAPPDASLALEPTVPRETVDAIEDFVSSDDPCELEPCALALCTPSEVAMLKELKALTLRAADDDAPWSDHVQGDVRLLRFMRKFGDAASAADAYRSMLRWREEFDLGAEPVKWRQRPSDFDYHDALFGYMPVSVAVSWSGEHEEAEPAGGGESGDALMHMLIGEWDTHGLARAVSADGELSEADFVQYWARVNELISLSIDALSRRSGRLAGCQVVVDLRGTSWRQFSRPFLAIMGLWSKMSEYYPSTSVEILFVNTPSFFKLIWQFMQPVLNADTRGKIRLCPAVEVEALLRRYDGRIDEAALASVATDAAGLKGQLTIDK